MMSQVYENIFHSVCDLPTDPLQFYENGARALERERERERERDRKRRKKRRRKRD